MAQQAPPRSASQRYAASALAAQKAGKAAKAAIPQGSLAVARQVFSYQTAQALMAERAVEEILLEQQITTAADALLNSAAFTTELARLEQMLAATNGDAGVERLASSLVQDAGRAAESVAVAVRKDIYHVRFVSLPCCSRCAVLSGRVYRWSDGFLRHPNCDCTMIPTTVASPYRLSPSELVASGQVHGLSKADLQAIDDGADVAQVVNVRLKSAGLSESGEVLKRANRLTPAGIYAEAKGDRARALELLKAAGYIR